MDLSEGQEVYLKYLMQKLNFGKNIFEDDFTKEFLEHLSKSSSKFKNIANCEKKEILYKGEKKYIPKDGLTSIGYKDKGDFFEALNLTLFQFLQLEYRIKNKKLFSDLAYTSKKVSATDISNYTFCPVSFSISKSIFYKTLESTEEGAKLHEKSILNEIVNRSKKSFTTSDQMEPDINYEESYQELKTTLEGFEILYSDHMSEYKEKIFESKNGRYNGKPDYILINKKEGRIIVVEEKYYHIPKEFYSYNDDPFYNDLEKKIELKRNKKQFHENHIYQLLSYIYGIKDYSIDFGLLVYWKYEYDDLGKPNVTKCHFKKVIRNEKSREKLNNIYSEIQKFKKEGIRNFNTEIRNPKKCANCVNSFLCGHKTGKFKKLTFPYSKSFLRTNYVEYPEMFKKSDYSEYKNIPYEERLLQKVEETKDFLDGI
ncbi:PD-(D/E)XK nuclease family protein [Salegentibacter sediminis]|uniref:hypothetical protein n=1 Tax=Salegentibacter sediminis TaxID=1930251 RepID=UPI0009C0215C|nr:hypothetical protein [Salegentibacter sediminis]